jgi:hypothetical protein
VEERGGRRVCHTMVKPRDSKSILESATVEKRVDDNLGAALEPGAGLSGDDAAVANTSVSAATPARPETFMSVGSPKDNRLGGHQAQPQLLYLHLVHLITF